MHQERVATVDEDEFTGQAAKKSKRQREAEEKAATFVKGHEAVELYLQCFQFILWKQVHWLVNTKGYPAELEVSNNQAKVMPSFSTARVLVWENRDSAGKAMP